MTTQTTERPDLAPLHAALLNLTAFHREHETCSCVSPREPAGVLHDVA